MFFCTCSFVKRIYLWLFNFMLGKQNRKLYRFFIHAITIMLLFLFIPSYFYTIIILFGESNEFAEVLSFIIMGPLVAIVFACLMKFMMRYFVSRKE